MRIAAAAVIALVCLWVIGVAFIARSMRRPPEEFAKIMTHVPGPAFMVIPFETLWDRARAGSLKVGQQAPEFNLSTHDHKAAVALSGLIGKPVVLVFGSYT